MKNYQEKRLEIGKLKNINDTINYARIHYSKILRRERAKIFNLTIQDSQMHPNEYNFSLRLAIDTSYIFMSFKENSANIFSKNKYILDSEKELFVYFIIKIYELDWQNEIVNYDNVDLRRYLSYKYDYPSINVYEYFKLFEYFDDIVQEVYGISIQVNFLDLLILITSKKDLYIRNKIFKKENLSIKKFNNLLIDERSINSSTFTTNNIREIFKGKIGIEFSDGLYTPRSYFLLDNIFRGVIDNNKSRNEKGAILEKYSKNIIKAFFDDVHQTVFDIDGNEQDLIIKTDDKLLFIECKSQNFKNIFIEGEDASQIRRNHFTEVILKACKQCQRGKDYVANNSPADYYNSNNKRKRKKILKVHNAKEKKLYKIVIILDEYLDLAELSNRYLQAEYKDTWIVNIFALNRILWYLKSKDKFETFFDYLEYRTQNFCNVESIHCDELAQFGYWISPNYNIYPPSNINIDVVLNNNFTNIFNEYDNYYWNILCNELELRN